MKEYRNGTGHGTSRSTKKIDEHFKISSDLLAEGFTWNEIADFINEMEETPVAMSCLRSSYQTRLKNISLTRSMEDEKEAAIQDLDAIMTKAIRAYNQSALPVDQVSEQGWVDDNGNITKPFKTIQKIKRLPNSKYLDTYMKAFDKKSKLLGWDKPKQMDITMFLKDLDIADGDGPKTQPIRSEEQAKDFGQQL